MSKKLILTEQQHAVIVSQILKETLDKINNIESNGNVNEGLMDTIKYGLSKLGRYKAGGKIFGKGKVDQEAARKIQQIIDKQGNAVIRQLDDTIRQENPEFPNNKEPEQFLSTVMSIAAVYDSVVASTKKNPNEEGYLPVDAANGVINDLREYVKKFLDVDLAAVYSTVNEDEDDKPTRDDVLGYLSDLFKSANGFRPNLERYMGLSDEELWMEIQKLEKEAEEEDDFEREKEAEFEETIEKVINSGAGDRATALRWMFNSDDYQDISEFLYKHGLSIYTEKGREIEQELEDILDNQSNLMNEVEASDVRQQLQAKRSDSGEDFASTRMDTLKSNRLPLTLAGVGSALGGLSWLVNTDWFRSLFEEVVQNPSVEYVKELVEKKSDVFASIKPGEGMTQIMNRLNGLNLNPNSSPQDFLDAVKQLGGGNLQAGIDALSADGGIFTNPDGAKQALEAIAQNPSAYGDNLGQMFQGNLAGTGKQVGDLLVTQTGGGLKGMVVNTIVQMVPKIVMKTGVKVGAGYAVAKGLGAALGPIGIGLIAAGALVKLMRMKGQKSSRAATLNALYQSIRNIEGGVGVVKPEGEVVDVATAQDPKSIEDKNKETAAGGATAGGGNVQDNLYNSLKNLFKFVVNNRDTLGAGAKSSSFRPNVGSRDSFFGGANQGSAGAQASKFKQGDQVTWTTKKGTTATGTVVGPSNKPNMTTVKSNTTGNSFEIRDNSLKTTLQEGKYIKDKRLLQYLNKSMAFEKVKNFEDLINRVEYIRNLVKKLKGKTDDKVILGFLKQLDSNPIMLTDFNKLFTVNVDNPQEVNMLAGMMKEILSTVYSGSYKGGNMIDKMAALGGGNINKLEEEAGYTASEPNKSFLKDAQSKTTFKKNLSNFLGVAMSLFQYLHKQKQQAASAKPKQEPQQAGGETQVDEMINPLITEELNRIKKIMFG